MRFYLPGKEEDIEEDAFEALFKQLEEDLKNDGLSFDDDDDEITEEDLIKLERELEEALADDDLLALFDDTTDEIIEMEVKDKKVVNKKGTTVNQVIEKQIPVINREEEEEQVEEDESQYEDEEEEEEVEDDEDGDGDEDEDEGPLELKRWQLRRLAYALKDGRRKMSIKNLAADLCLDRAIVLELLRDPPPDLLLLSASLPDKPDSTILRPVIKPEDAALLASERDALKATTTKKVPVHEMQSNWSAKKRLKKVHVETLERVYRRSKRPTNAMISNIVHVTKIPRKKVLKWFEDKRGEDGVPDQRQPYQRIQENIPWCMIFADDIVLIAKSAEGLNNLGLRVSREKTEHLRCDFGGYEVVHQKVDIRIGYRILKPKESFRYLTLLTVLE
ncbi:protein overexpressor of cationic peroxidase 3 [Tanacetum coccineum]